MKTRATGRPTASVLAILWVAAAAPAADSLSYVLKPDPASGRILVDLTWQTDGRESSTLSIAPRAGSVTDVRALIQDLKFDGAAPVSSDANRWVFQHRRGATLRCRYAVDAGRREFDWNTTHHPITTRNFFHGIGSTFLITPGVGGGIPDEMEIILRWELPEGWRAACSWGVGKHLGERIALADLRQSVYLAGPLTIVERPKAAHPLTIALVEGVGFDQDEFATMAEQIIDQQCEFMREQHFPPFVITVIPVGKPLKSGDAQLVGAGLYQSFALWVAPQSKINDATEHLFAHELFHFWNGRVLQAEDPDKLVYWFVEGFTDYFALKILFESGRWPAETYAKWLNRHIRDYAHNPAIHASNEEIKDKFWRERDTVGEVAYQRGLLLGLRWHKLARDRGVADGLDAMFRKLVERGREGRFKASNEALRKAGVELLGTWFGEEFDRFVTRAETVDVPADSLAPQLSGKIATVYAYELGFERERSLKEQRVVGLVAGSAAEKAGLRDGDELAGWTVTGDSDRKVELKVLRDGKVRTISYFPRGRSSEVLQFEPAKAPAPKKPALPDKPSPKKKP